MAIVFERHSVMRRNTQFKKGPYRANVVLNNFGNIFGRPQVEFDEFERQIRHEKPWFYWFVRSGDITFGQKTMTLMDAIMLELGIGEEEASDPYLLFVLALLVDYFAPDYFFRLVPPVVAAARLMNGTVGENLYYLLGLDAKRKRSSYRKSSYSE
jgi:hypothetical protein